MGTIGAPVRRDSTAAPIGIRHGSPKSSTIGAVLPRVADIRRNVARGRAISGTCQATPAIADGRIYLRTGQHLMCIGEP